MRIFTGGSGGDVYPKALRKGKDEVIHRAKLGKHPYLKDLDSKLAGTKIISEVSIGLIDAPLRQIVGTYTKTRGSDFSRSYYPLLHSNTEFAMKWENVYKIQENEGLRDAVKAYEFMNQLYIIEGNKRISVLKFIGLYSFPAMVTRLMPRKDTNNIKTLVYYACLDFYKLAGFNGIWFSKPEKYEKLAHLIEKNKDRFIAENPYKYVATSVYEKFRDLYIANGGKGLPITTADAFLYFVNINGFDEPEYSHKYEIMMKRYVKTLAATTSTKIDDFIKVNIPYRSTIMNPLSRLVPLKIGFIYPDGAQTDWGAYHKEAQDFIEEKYFNKAIVQSYKYVSSHSKDHNLINDIVKQNDVVFAISPLYYKGLLRASLQNPSKSIFLCSSFSKFEYIETYHGRCYEPSFILGALGASLCSSDDMIFIAPQMLPSAFMNLNAFAQGAKLINSKARIKLITKTKPDQSDEDFNDIIVRELEDLECDACYSASFFMDSKSLFKHMGLYQKIDDQWQRIARPYWRWNEFYDTIMADVISNRFNSLDSIIHPKNKRLNYWWGLDTGMLDVEVMTEVGDDSIRLIKFLKQGIINKIISPFAGPLHDKNNVLRIKDGETARLSDIIDMNWLVNDVDTNVDYQQLQLNFEKFNGSID